MPSFETCPYMCSILLSGPDTYLEVGIEPLSQAINKYGT